MPSIDDILGPDPSRPKSKPTVHDVLGPPPASPYEGGQRFSSDMNQTFGKGKWTLTGGYRTPERENQLRGQGAATVPAGHTSAHSKGTADAPGAYDITVAGMDPTQASKRLPKGYQGLPEGAAGGQGAHLHVGLSPTVDSILGPARNPEAQHAKPSVDDILGATPKISQPPILSHLQRDRSTLGGEALGLGKQRAGAAAKALGRDLTDPGLDPMTRTSRTVMDVLGIPTGFIGGAVQAGEQAIEQASGQGYGKPGTGRDAGGRKAQLAGDIAEGIFPIPGAAEAKAAKEAIEAAKGVMRAGRDVAGVRGVERVVGIEKDPIERIDNALYRLGGHATADKLEALQALKAAPKEVRDPKVQEDLTHAIERKIVDPNAVIPPELQRAEVFRQPWAERQRVAVNQIREKLAARGLSEEEVAQYAPDTGYVPRRVVGKSPGFDLMDTERKSPLAIFQGKRSLARSTGSLKARDQIALQFEDGTSRFEHRNPSNDEWKPGMEVRDPLTGRKATVRQATIKEVEGAKARDRNGEPITYHKNALVNTIDEALKAERVNRNLDVLDELTKNMKDAGLAHQDEWHFKNEDGQWVRARSNAPRPEGFQELPNLPQLKGWSFDPKVAEVLKDYYPGPDEPLDKVLSVANRALNASLFITPFPHIKNVGTMGFIGRGWDWLPTGTNYGRLMASGRDAIKEVVTMGPKYREFLREGAGMQAGDDATRNFYQQMLESAAKGIANDPQIGKAMGLNPIEVGKALYNASHKILWNVNDMVMLQRYLELQAKGMGKREAIKEAERWVANYRIPSQVLKSRAAAQLFKDGKWINFGRYTYGKWRAIGEMIKGLSTGSVAQRTDALGKVVAMGVLGLIGYPLMDKAAQAITGNKKAKVGRGGDLAPLDAMADPEKDWVAKMSSILTPAPVIDTGAEVLHNRTAFGQEIISSMGSPGGQVAEGMEYAAGQFYPAQLGMEALKPGGVQQAAGRFVGVNLPPEDRDAKRARAQKYQRRAARRREARDPIIQGLEHLGR